MATQKLHLGIYGVIVNDGQILLIKKSRGPYKGKFDLPGGKIEHGEDLQTALKREIIEETGVTYNSSSLLTNLSTRVEFEDSGDLIDMHHIGLIYKIEGFDLKSLVEEMELEDSLGAIWIDTESISAEKLSPFAYEVILKYLSKTS